MAQFQSKERPDYQGTENLEVMSVAVNYNRFLHDQIHRYAPRHAQAMIYDFGAGTGQFTNIWNAKDVKVGAIEIDPTLCQRLAEQGHDVYALDDIQHGTADYIYSINVLEHIEDDEAVMAEIFNKLKSGSRFYVYVPAFTSLWMPMDDLVGHVRRYRKSEMVQKLKTAGFEIESASYIDSAGFFATLLMKPFARADGVLNVGLVKLFDQVCFPVGRLLDKLIFGWWLGKNVAVLAKKPEAR